MSRCKLLIFGQCFAQGGKIIRYVDFTYAQRGSAFCIDLAPQLLLHALINIFAIETQRHCIAEGIIPRT